MDAPPIGARAYFLLGLLVGQTRTVPEIEAAIAEAIERPDLLELLDVIPFDHGSPAVSLRSLADAGTDELRRILGRLEEFGLAKRVVIN